MKRVAVIWNRFGPYHLARLEGAAALLGPLGVEVHGLEIARTDSVYAWAVTEAECGFARHTLIEGDYHAQSASAIGRAVTTSLDRLRPDGVAINGWAVPEARAALDWCGRHGARAVLMSETKVDDVPRRWWKEALKRRRVRRFDAALVGGAPHRDYAISLGIPADRVELGYDAVDNDYFARGADAARSDADRLRAERGLPARYALACTRFIARKNLDGLLRAHHAHRRADPDGWDLVIAGGGEEADRLRQLAEALAVPGVHWPGFVQYDQLPALYGLASAFVHPALAEPWGLVVNEAAASGVPLLVSRTVGSSYELVVEDQTGWRFDPLDTDGLAALLQRTSSLPECDRERIGAAARARVAAFGPARFARGLARTLGLER